MAAERLSMRKIKEVLRLSALGQSPGQIARSLDIGENTVRRYLRRAEEAGLGWPLEPEFGDGALEARLFPPAPSDGTARPVPDWAEVQRELRRKGVTLQLLWLEYKAVHPEAGYQYTQFCEHYRRWRDRLDPVLRQEHRAGEKTFVDYAGQTVPVVDPTTGEIREAQIFVGVLGASSFTFAEATWTQALTDWIGSHVRMFAYFGGASAAIVPDNLRSGVTRACFYDPDINPTYQDLATHYGTAVLPTRPGHPRDKAKVESGVQVAERWLLAPLRNQLFHGLGELNRALAERLELLNDRPFQKIEGSRRSLFETFERDALRPLPPEPFEIAKRRKARVNIDYHVDVLGHLYSVPYQLVRKPVEVRLTTTTVEIFHDGRRVAAHVRSFRKGGFTTEPGHRPKSHQTHLDWSPSRLVRWATKTGPSTAALVQHVLDSRPHPEHGYRACLGILRLGDRYGPERLEAACRRALSIGGTTYRSVKSILEHGLDREPLTEEQTALRLPQAHPHLRGPAYYSEP
jgi:transposase